MANGDVTRLETIGNNPLFVLLTRGSMILIVALLGIGSWVYESDRATDKETFQRIFTRVGSISDLITKDETTVALITQNFQTLTDVIKGEHDRVDRANSRIDAVIDQLQTMRIDLTRLQDRQNIDEKAHR